MAVAFECTVAMCSQRTDAASMQDASRRPNPTKRGMWLSALIALLGVYLVLEVAIFELVAAQLWNDLLVGLLLVGAGGYNFHRQLNAHDGSVGVAGIAVLIGLWLVVSPFVFGPSAPLMPIAENIGSWNNIAVGVATIALGAYSAYRIRERRTSDMRTAAA